MANSTITKITDLTEGDIIAWREDSTFEVWEVQPHPKPEQFPNHRQITGYLNRPAGICEPWTITAKDTDVFITSVKVD